MFYGQPNVPQASQPVPGYDVSPRLRILTRQRNLGRMFVPLRHRYLHVVALCGSLLPIAIDTMAPSLGPGSRRKGKTSVANNGSTASTPSLRSKTPVLVEESQPSSGMGQPGGNVKVVVRVRAFLPRGICKQKSAERFWHVNNLTQRSIEAQNA